MFGEIQNSIIFSGLVKFSSFTEKVKIGLLVVLSETNLG